MTEMDKDLAETGYLKAPDPVILTSSKFRRLVGHGMKVWRSETRNIDNGTVVEHIEMACPGYELTKRGPELVVEEEAQE